MFGDYATEAEFAIQAVGTAAQLARRIQEEMITPAIQKQDRSPVTVADFAAQALIGRMFLSVFSDDPLVGEEGSGYLRAPENQGALEAVTRYVRQVHAGATAEDVWRWIDRGDDTPREDRFWTLDPIDGTKGFLRGDQYVVALALIEAGQVVLGALACPNLDPGLRSGDGDVGVVLIAARGAGSWSARMEGRDFRQLTVSQRTSASEARLLRSVESGHTDVEKMARFVAALGTEEPPVLMDSQAKFALLAGGRAELIVRMVTPDRPDYAEHIWDQAAGSIIVEEAGGRVTDLQGQELDFLAGKRLHNNVGVLVSNGRLHSQALAALSQVGADRRPWPSG